jgi:ArsR family transcriptional regulator, arsenate/arsenite/antimonite-responsive transcriptional repressor / arsenate reductase (thioredoxin)
VHAALGEPVRLAMVDDLGVTDRSPKELGERFGLAPNLLAHHLEVLENVGLIERFVSSGDRRRRYVRLLAPPLDGLTTPTSPPPRHVLFVCTRNSARSPLAAALWRARTGIDASSGGTHPADSVHPGAVAAAERAGLDLGGAAPRHLSEAPPPDLVVTVCDRAHEEIEVEPSWWHWSTVDPVPIGTRAAFDRALADLDARIRALDDKVAAT